MLHRRILIMDKKEEQPKKKYIVKDEHGNIMPIEVPEEFMNTLKAMIKEKQEERKQQDKKK